MTCFSSETEPPKGGGEGEVFIYIIYIIYIIYNTYIYTYIGCMDAEAVKESFNVYNIYNIYIYTIYTYI
jgi:hypothetical protein